MPAPTETPAAQDGSDFNRLMSLLATNFEPASEEAKVALRNSVQICVTDPMPPARIDDPVKFIRGIMAEFDRKLSEQINLILHHPDFQNLESSWRGLHHLVQRTETSDRLVIRFMNIS